jgi:hypothetical protein
MKKIKLYVGCALNNAPEGFAEKVIEMRSVLSRDPHYQILEFLGKGGTPEDVYRFDIEECVEKADAMLAVCDYPSLGLGFEMAVHCKGNKKPLLAIAHTDANVSRLVIGIHNAGPFSFERYGNLSEAPGMLEHFLKEAGVL